MHAVQVEHADFGQADLAVAVKRLVAGVVHRAPDLDAHFVAGAEHVFGRRGGSGVGGVGQRVVKQLGTKVRQQLARAALHKALELAGGLWLGRAQGAEGVALCILCAEVGAGGQHRGLQRARGR